LRISGGRRLAEKDSRQSGCAPRYDIPFADLRKAQIEAMNERFQERNGQIEPVAHRAGEAGVTEVRSHEDVAKLLLPHTAYKSYPERG